MSTPTSAISVLASSFPTLRAAPGVSPFEAPRLDAWASGPAPSSGAFHAARFVLAVWNERVPWKAGRFDAIAAVGVWDEAHRAAFAAWATSPWTA